MKVLTQADVYRSPERDIGWLAHRFPSVMFYAGIVSIVISAARRAKGGRYQASDWVQSSLDCVALLESVGGRFIFENLDIIKKNTFPSVFIGNHMSVLETFVLPCLIRPHRKVTFVIKQSLIDYPAFKHVMISRNPIVVGRVDPRRDLKTVLEQGQQRLDSGKSVIIFPQTTRSIEFEAHKFNSLGIKLAKRAGVPVIPFALKTDAWGMGTWQKDVGWIRPGQPVHIRFGAPMTISGAGKDDHQAVVDFIGNTLAEWNESDRAINSGQKEDS